MLKINHEKLFACDLDHGDDDVILNNLLGALEWLEAHSRHYTKTQYNNILDALDIVKALEIVEG